MNGLSSSQLTNSLVASLSMSVPILADWFLDCLAYGFSYFHFHTMYIFDIHSKGSNYAAPFREVIFLIILPDALLLFWFIPFKQYDILASLLGARDTMFMYSFLAYMVRYNNPIWTWRSVIVIVVSFMSANIILTIQSQVFSLSANILAVNSVLLPFFVSLALLALSINMIRWFRYVKLKYNHGNNEQEDIRMILCSVCAVCYYIFILGDWLIFYAPKSTSPTWTSILGYNYLTMYSYLMAGTILMISIISNRIIKKESLESKVSND